MEVVSRCDVLESCFNDDRTAFLSSSFVRRVKSFACKDCLNDVRYQPPPEVRGAMLVLALIDLTRDGRRAELGWQAG